MDPRDVNRINYNNYFVGQNLDFLVRSKMRSESLSTPLKNTPAFYDDQVTSKMTLLGKRGFYDPGYIYGFPNSDPNQETNNPQGNRNEEEYTNPVTREQYDQLILPKEHYREQLLRNYEMNNNINNNINPNNNINNKNFNNDIPKNNNINEEEMYYKEKERERLEMIKEKERLEMLKEKERLEMLKERQTPQKLDNFQLNRINNNQINYEINNINNNPNANKEQFHPNYPPYYQKEKENMELYNQMKYESGMVRNRDKIPNVNYSEQINEYNYINDIAKKNVGDLVLPPTKNQILQEVYLENFNRKNSPK